MRDRMQEKNHNVIFINNQLAGAFLLIIAVVVLMITLPLTEQDEEEIVVQEAVVEKKIKCLPIEYEVKYPSGTECKGNSVSRIWSNTLGFSRTDVKQIVGRLVQIETGNHITLESGERYAISNGMSEIWIDDIVKLHKINFKANDCVYSAIKFENRTAYYTKDFHFKDLENSRTDYTLISEEELIEKNEQFNKLIVKYEKEIREHNRYWYFQDDEYDQDCKKASVWEIEKI